MQYFVYKYSTGLLNIDYGPRDESNGIIGAVDDLPDPIATAGSFAVITEKAYSHLGRHPGDMLYIADSNRLLYEIAINRQYQQERSAASKSLFVAWSCFLLCVLSFVATLC